MKIYITAPFKGTENKQEIEEICATIKAAGAEDFCFIRDRENYNPIFSDNPPLLMQKAKEDLTACDALFIEVSQKPSNGCIIEAGMAYSMGKKIIGIAKPGSDISTTLRWILDILIEYNTIEDIREPLKNYLHSLNI